MIINLNIPTAWNQVPTKTLKKLASYFYQNKKGKQLDLLIFFALINAKWWQLKKMFKAFRILKYVGLTELKEHYQYIYKEANLTRFIPSLKIPKKTIFAPGDRLHNISILEFAVCEDLYFHFTNTQNLEYIRFIAAVLYREKKQGLKIQFNKDTLEERVKLLSKIDKKTLLVIAMSYKGSSLEIQNSYKYVFKKAAVSKKAKKQKPKAPGLESIISQLSGEKFGNLKETEQTNVHSFLSELNKQLKPK